MTVLDPGLYRTVDRLGTAVLGWVAVFACWTSAKTLAHLAGRTVRFSDHMSYRVTARRPNRDRRHGVVNRENTLR